MTHCRIRVTAASRLHFGLMAVGDQAGRQFGGVGVMVSPPQTKLTIAAADRLHIEGPCAQRVREFADRWRNYRGWPALPACRITVDALPRMHSGLGAGTQLALSVAAGLNAFFQQPADSAERLTASVGRGQRSAVGTYGFFQGGLVAEQGKTGGESLAPLLARVPLPEQWRFVLVCPADQRGLHGEVEQQAFDALPPVSTETFEALKSEVCDHILPAAAAGDFPRFSAGIYRFGFQSGMSFAPVQEGPYNGPLLTRLVRLIQSLGITGVGQSSWGPTLFALCEHATEAESLVLKLKDELPPQTEIGIATPWNQGALVERAEPAVPEGSP